MAESAQVKIKQGLPPCFSYAHFEVICVEKEKLIGEYQAELKKVMDRIEEALANRKECMSTEGRKRLALLYGMRNSLCFSLKEMTKD